MMPDPASWSSRPCNLTSDGVKTYEYDAENQLTNLFVAARWRTGFVYDGWNRLRIKREYKWQSGTWSLTNEVRYIYDGNVVVQERNGSNQIIATYTRGTDFSGTFDRAGGIRGLLALTLPGSQHFFYHHDGNGNVTAMTDNMQFLAARYVYDPFGNILSLSGRMAGANNYLFSGKLYDWKTGLIYYGRRFYDPNLQRWSNRDPISEEGGINLYLLVLNNPISAVDIAGLLAVDRIKDVRLLLTLYKHARDIMAIVDNPALRVSGINPATRLLTGSAYAALYSATAVAQASADILSGNFAYEAGSIGANAIDFVTHIINGDSAAAALDSATLAAQLSGGDQDSSWRSVLSRGYGTSDAVTAWWVLELMAESVNR